MPTERLTRQVEELQRSGSFRVFAAFVREGPVRRWLRESLRLTEEDFAAALVDLDNRQAEFLPERIDDIAPRTAKRLRAIFEFVKVQLRKRRAAALVAAIGRTSPDGDGPVPAFAAPAPGAAAPSGRAGALGGWKLRLPTPPPFRELKRISPTRLDGYLRCPFTFYLSDKAVLGGRRIDDRARELPRWEFGNLVHEALEAFGLSELKDAADATALGAFLDGQVDAWLTARFGANVPPGVREQGEDARRRLRDFARRQAARRAAGWRIAAVERKLECPFPFARPDGSRGEVLVYGKCDRIDFNERTGDWCVIDYKTWDRTDKASCREVRADGSSAWKSLQLPLYCAMLAADGSGEFAGAARTRISACYCTLGATADSVRFAEPIGGDDLPSAEAAARRLLPRIERGVFWPPSPAAAWRRDFADWLSPSPEEVVDADWIADQDARLSRFLV